MSATPTPTPSGRNAQDVKAGPLPVPWLIPLCIFTPFFISFLIFVIHRYTVVRQRNKLAAAREAAGEQPVLGKDAELEILKFLGKA